jgi:hypothetical protein
VSQAPDPRTFYTETLPAHWNRALAEQERAVEAARRVLDGMRAVDATIRVEVRGAGGGTFYLNVAQGRLAAGDAPAHAPFLTLVQDRPAFERLAAEAGDSAMAMLGGLSGLAGEMKLTRARLDLLAGVKGCLRFEVKGEDGFALLTLFGDGPLPERPDTTITVDPDAYRALRGGELNPQDAFLSGRIAVEGDMQLAMQIALAAMSPD